MGTGMGFRWVQALGSRGEEGESVAPSDEDSGRLLPRYSYHEVITHFLHVLILFIPRYYTQTLYRCPLLFKSLPYAT